MALHLESELTSFDFLTAEITVSIDLIHNTWMSSNTADNMALFTDKHIILLQRIHV